MTTFDAQAFQNEYLADGATEVNAVVTITATDEASPTTHAATEAAEIVIIDTSGSMGNPKLKLRSARAATNAAIDCLRDGVRFGIIAGNHDASVVYPDREGLVVASEVTRERAKGEVHKLTAKGGTAIGTWLELARSMFATAPTGIHHAVMLTDGRDEHETPEQLAEVLAKCEGEFQCDCRGVGTDWEVEELRRVATALLGSVDIVAEPADLVDDFRSMVEHAMEKSTNDVALRLWTPRGATVAFVKQVSPTIEDLTDRGTAVDEQTVDYPTGAWGPESRDYHVCIRVPAHPVGEEMLAGRFRLVVDDEVATQALIRAVWTDEEQLSTRINREVAHYTGQAEIADAIAEGLDARKAGDEDTATMKLGRAVKLASESGHDDTVRLLEGVVDVEDAATGTVRLRADVDTADEMALDTRSTKTVRVQPGS
jgi:Mg-chelatase subunit ChlD